MTTVSRLARARVGSPGGNRETGNSATLCDGSARRRRWRQQKRPLSHRAPDLYWLVATGNLPLASRSPLLATTGL